MPHEDFFIYVIAVAVGDKIPRKNGPGISLANILIISKTDVAPYVHASLEVMENDSRLMRDKPVVFTNCLTGMRRLWRRPGRPASTSTFLSPFGRCRS